MSQPLTGHVALVTGASRGIGRRTWPTNFASSA